MAKSEFYGVLTKVFYSGNARKQGGVYNLTFIDVETKEEKILYVKLRLKVEFDINSKYVYKVTHNYDNITKMQIKANSINDYINGNLVNDKHNVVKSKQEIMASITYWVVVFIVSLIVYLIILNIMGLR